MAVESTPCNSVRPPVRLAMLVSHPIQYQAPLLKRVAQMPDVELEVFFQSDVSTREFRDVGFGQTVRWDVPLLDGYKFTFLPILIGSPDKIGIWTPINSGMIHALRRGRFDALWVHGYARPYNIAVVLAARLMGLKVLVRDDVHKRGKRRRLDAELVKHTLIRLYALLGVRFLAIGKANSDYYRELGAPAASIITAPYAVDNAFFQQRAFAARGSREAFRRELGLEEGAPVILFAGKFQPRKRAADLLAAYRRMLEKLGQAGPTTPYLLYAGSGEKLEETRAQAEGLERVRFLGFQTQAQLAQLFDLCDVFVMPSAMEPWGLVVNEVMNAGKPVIVTDEAGCGPDLVKPGENGFIYPTGDCEQLAEQLATLMRSPELRAQMGRRSLEIIDRWSFEEDCDALRLALAETPQGVQPEPVMA